MLSAKLIALSTLAASLSMPAPRLAAQQVRGYTSHGRFVSYEIFEKTPHGPLLILLHGVSGPKVAFYREQAKFFADHGYTVFYLHYFDATKSNDPSDKNYQLWESALHNLMDEMQKNPAWSGRKRALLGFSLGASIALAAGSQNEPVAAIAEWYGSLPTNFSTPAKACRHC